MLLGIEKYHLSNKSVVIYVAFIVISLRNETYVLEAIELSRCQRLPKNLEKIIASCIPQENVIIVLKHGMEYCLEYLYHQLTF